MNIEKSQLEQIQELCKSNKVKSLFAFGSVIREDFNETSDVDLLIDINETDPFAYTDLYFSLKSKIEDILRRPIDLLEARAINNILFKQELNNTMVRIYG